MLLLVRIDLRNADLVAFDRYEALVLGRIQAYGGAVEFRVRSVDQKSETHLLSFPDSTALENFRKDEVRSRAQPLLLASRAASTSEEVQRL